jgi:hypothetical protein
MAESIHDWAVKLGMLRDEASFSAGEKLMENFTQSVIKNDNRVKQSAKERADAEKQARLMAEGEKIRQANLTPMASANESTIRSMERLDELFVQNAISVDLWEKELNKAYQTFLKLEAAEESRLSQAGMQIQSAGAEAEVERAQTLADLKADILERSAEKERIHQARLSQEYATTIQMRKEQEQSYESDMAAMRDFYRQQEVEGVRQARADRLAAEETAERRLAARISGYNSQQRRDAARTRAEEVRLASEAAKAKLLIDGQYEQETRRLMMARNSYNATQDEANSLLRRYGNIAEDAAADIQRLNAMHEAGIISTERHGAAVAEATRRMNSMRGGAGNIGYAIGELARGAEDFITVMSMAGFKAESVGMAMRGAGNNISQAANLMIGPLYGAVIGVGAILGGQFLSSWLSAGKEVDKFNTYLERTTYLLSQLAKGATRDLEVKFAKEDLADSNFDQNAKDIKAATRDIERMNAAIKESEADVTAFIATIVNKALGGDTKKEMDGIFSRLDAFSDPVVVDKFRQKFDQIQTTLAGSIADGLDPDVAFKAYIERMKILAEEVDTQINLDRPRLPDEEFNFESPMGNAVASIASLKEINELNQEGLNRVRNLLEVKKDLTDQEQKLKDMLEAQEGLGRKMVAEQIAANLKESETAYDALRVGADNLKLKSEELLMMSKLTEQEKLAYEFAKRRAEIMESGVAAPDALEDIFKTEMEAKINELTLKNADFTKQWESSAPTMAVSTATKAQAFADANKTIMNASGETKDKELIKAMRAVKDAMKAVEEAIRNPNRDRGVMFVEVK